MIILQLLLTFQFKEKELEGKKLQNDHENNSCKVRTLCSSKFNIYLYNKENEIFYSQNSSLMMALQGGDIA